MWQTEDGRGVEAAMAYLKPGRSGRKGRRKANAGLTPTQANWFRNLMGSWLVYGVGLSLADAAAVLSRTVSEKRLRAVVHGMPPVLQLPGAPGRENAWRFLSQAPPDDAPRRPRPRELRKRPRPRGAAGGARTSTARRTTSAAG